MKKFLVILSLVLMVASCASKKNSVIGFIDPAFREKPPLKKIVIVSDHENLGQNLLVERSYMGYINKVANVNTFLASDILPPTRKFTTKEAKKLFAEKDIDAKLVFKEKMSQVYNDVERDFVGPTIVGNFGFGGGWGNGWGWGGNPWGWRGNRGFGWNFNYPFMGANTATYQVSRTLKLYDLELIDMKTSEVMWKATSQISARGRTGQLFVPKAIVHDSVNELIRLGLLEGK